jgi:NNP family nitrate/nitrite transporter-like MFS transporter
MKDRRAKRDSSSRRTRAGGERLLAYVFGGIAVLAWLMTLDSIYAFTVGALGSAMLLGLGNGAVFKLVAQMFPVHTGTATGLVGAAGGIGGFFPPLVLGVSRDLVHSYAPGFALLSAFALGCEIVLVRAVVHRGPSAAMVDARRGTRG